MAEQRLATSQPGRLEAKVPVADVDVATVDAGEFDVTLEGSQKLVDATKVELVRDRGDAPGVTCASDTMNAGAFHPPRRMPSCDTDATVSQSARQRWTSTPPATIITARSSMNTHLLMITFRVWFIEIAVSGFNYFVLMNRVYAPRIGELRAHRIGMATRIVYIFPFAYVLVRWAGIDSAPEYLLAGTYWLLMVLAFEWIGSFIIRRPVHEILEGWHIEEGYMWPYVLLAYFLSPLIVGLLLSSGK